MEDGTSSSSRVANGAEPERTIAGNRADGRVIARFEAPYRSLSQNATNQELHWAIRANATLSPGSDNRVVLQIRRAKQAGTALFLPKVAVHAGPSDVSQCEKC
jgi:hypothetical protein